MKTINGKAIYSPNGKAGEYARYACNFYVGCSNGCHYCYLRKGVLAHAMGGDKPTLKKCFKDEAHSLKIFEEELKANLPELQEHGLFLSFSTDPMLRETIKLTMYATEICVANNIPVKILTKCAGFSQEYVLAVYRNWKKHVAFGFTLTRHDELEPGASTNAERIEAMQKLHDEGFKTWASIEPVIDVDRSYTIIQHVAGFCDLYKIGILSGKTYPNNDLKLFVGDVIGYHERYLLKSKIYFKDSLLAAIGRRREDLPMICVTRDYDIFKDK
jgi:DNA repair photolyase